MITLLSRLTLYCIFYFSLTIDSHELNPSRLILEEKNSNDFLVTWLFPINLEGQTGEVIFPSECNEENQDLPRLERKYSIEKFSINCLEDLKGKILQFKGLSRMVDALISVKFNDGTAFEGLVSVDDPTIEIPLEKTLYPTSYFWLGVEHLLSGIDHIIFILGLFFVVQGMSTLIKTITAFTLAHSITLFLSVLDLIKLSQATAEALIALTLIYLALEISNGKKYQKTPWLIAFGFGLIHGFGFAGALSEIGLSSNNLGISLFLFNVGIEIGQLIVIPIVLAFIWLLNRSNITRGSYLISSYLIGGIGMFWLIERITNIVI